ncbi:hypothetical protein A3E39_03385 [Candidatus Uhrbacteria bacterium RIFCSPHIGHO2_12_FULL_60_25]|uniref:DUF4384 domain-containing protein n=1 Tax=Candidatus Uhrbacteria bacterium RIFCSPHIGHO2_12_FULL_60_25 TaxID=1802399 RepID=A0A1F7UP66_9BACT|nr:MAG: hypothetical protein A3D73_03220 [Candidatus Uhrbacteria bacterium RIFCSPHIGHO2_02_FULL_60_44]OGL79554.1 MAG: hypothetical protein A3E39_03385 [Candidatus Uhrbacteria bacterium RIFCSPHIGHO2_12_FULL_60_25]
MKNVIVTMIVMIMAIFPSFGCSANLELAQENGALKARLAAQEKRESQLLAKLRDAPPNPVKDEVVAAPDPAPAPVATPAPAPAPKPVPPETRTAIAAPRPFSPLPAPAFAVGGTVGPGVGYISRDPMDGRPCGGMCMRLINKTPYFMHVFVDGREMTVFDGYEQIILPVNGAKLAGGRQPRAASLVPHHRQVRWAMDSVGEHTILVVFYTMVPGQVFLQPVGTWEMRRQFPVISFGVPAQTGYYQNVYGPTRRIDSY